MASARRPAVASLAATLAATLAVTAGAPAVAQLPTFPGTTTTRPPPSTTTTQPWPTDPGTTTTTTTQPPPPPPDTAPAGPAPAPAPADPGAPPPADGPPPPPADGPGPAAPDGGAPPGDQAPGAAPAGAGQPPPLPPPGAAPGPPPPAPGEVPPEARAAMVAVRRSGSNSTRRLMEALEPLRRLGLSEPEVIAAGFGRFPVGGHATFSHDWLFPRFTPTFHLHEGTDIFAAAGTPVRAPADGVLRLSQGGSGGLAAYVYEPNGTYHYMAHLSAFVPGQRPGQQVRTGEVVGFVGDSGNAEGGSPHVHFEYHPAPTRAVASGKGRNRTVTRVVRPVPVGSVLPPVDPKAMLDQWLAEAEAAAPAVVASVQQARQATTAVPAAAAAPAPAGPPTRAALLWASSVSPAAAAVRLAEAAALDAASGFDWAAAARRHRQRLDEQAAALARAEAILGPLTPPGLRRDGTTAAG